MCWVTSAIPQARDSGSKIWKLRLGPATRSSLAASGNRPRRLSPVPQAREHLAFTGHLDHPRLAQAVGSHLDIQQWVDLVESISFDLALPQSLLEPSEGNRYRAVARIPVAPVYSCRFKPPVRSSGCKRCCRNRVIRSCNTLTSAPWP